MSLDGVKYDTPGTKPSFDLILPEFLEAFAQVLTYGAEKYDADNWRKLPDLRRRYLSALYRHLNALHRGEVMDSESGLAHSAQIATNAMFIFWHDVILPGIDFREAYKDGLLSLKSAADVQLPAVPGKNCTEKAFQDYVEAVQKFLSAEEKK